MDAGFLIWMWFGVGVTLIAAEFALPGLVSIFGGMAALVVAALSFLGVTESLTAQLIAWMLLSITMVITLRKAARNHFKGDVRRADISEARMHYGKKVTVLEPISDAKEGRIRYQGSTWSALSTGDELKEGDLARLVFQDNLTWIVERFVDDESNEGDIAGVLTAEAGETLVVPEKESTTSK